MKDTSEYSTIYHLGHKTILVHKDGSHYSVLLEDKDTYTEVIVPSKALEDAMNYPAADETTWVGQLRMLFGNFDGFDHLIKFCKDNYITTKTFVWTK